MNQVMIRTLLAGASKRHICQKMVDHGYTILFVCPTNRLSHQFGSDAIPKNKFVGNNFGNWVFIGRPNSLLSNMCFATRDARQLKSVHEMAIAQDYETTYHWLTICLRIKYDWKYRREWTQKSMNKSSTKSITIYL